MCIDYMYLPTWTQEFTIGNGIFYTYIYAYLWPTSSSLQYLLPQSCIEYTSVRTWLELTTLEVLNTACIGRRKSN
jgi:hypothetical protein